MNSWTVSHSARQGKPLIARINRGLIPLIGDSRYGHCIGVAVQFKAPTDNGFPLPEESAQLSEIEDALAAALEQNHESLFAAVITTNGMREFLFYTSDVEAVKAKLAVVIERIDTYEKVGRAIKPDPDWTIYRRLVY
jgi:hypothetical protein